MVSDPSLTEEKIYQRLSFESNNSYIQDDSLDVLKLHDNDNKEESKDRLDMLKECSFIDKHTLHDRSLSLYKCHQNHKLLKNYQRLDHSPVDPPSHIAVLKLKTDKNHYYLTVGNADRNPQLLLVLEQCLNTSLKEKIVFSVRLPHYDSLHISPILIELYEQRDFELYHLFREYNLKDLILSNLRNCFSHFKRQDPYIILNEILKEKGKSLTPPEQNKNKKYSIILNQIMRSSFLKKLRVGDPIFFENPEWVVLHYLVFPAPDPFVLYSIKSEFLTSLAIEKIKLATKFSNTDYNSLSLIASLVGPSSRIKAPYSSSAIKDTRGSCEVRSIISELVQRAKSKHKFNELEFKKDNDDSLKKTEELNIKLIKKDEEDLLAKINRLASETKNDKSIHDACKGIASLLDDPSVIFPEPEDLNNINISPPNYFDNVDILERSYSQQNNQKPVVVHTYSYPTRRLWFSTKLLMLSRIYALSIPNTGELTSMSWVSVWWIPAIYSDKVLIHFHGNGEDSGESLDRLASLSSTLQVSIMAVEYRGYGSTKSWIPTTKHCCDAAISAYDFIHVKLRVPSCKIYALGRSIGGGPACHLASYKKLRGLILISTFTRLRDVALLWSGALQHWKATAAIISNSMWKAFDNVDRLETIQCDVLFIHGTHDDLIPFSHAETNYTHTNLQYRAFLVRVEGEGHDINYFNNTANVIRPLITHFPELNPSRVDSTVTKFPGNWLEI